MFFLFPSLFVNSNSLIDVDLCVFLQKHMGDADYLAVFHHILLPIAYEVNKFVCVWVEIFIIVHATGN